MSEEQTILARMTAAGISKERAEEHLRSGFVRVGDKIVTDPAAVLTGKYVLIPPPITNEG